MIQMFRGSGKTENFPSKKTKKLRLKFYARQESQQGNPKLGPESPQQSEMYTTHVNRSYLSIKSPPKRTGPEWEDELEVLRGGIRIYPESDISKQYCGVV